MKIMILSLFTGVLLSCGCINLPAVSKSDMGNLEINISATEGLDASHARIYVDDVFIGNVSSRMPVLQLKRGKRVNKVELEGAGGYTETITILGEPNHQVLNVLMKRNA